MTVAESIRVRFSEFVLPHFSPAETASAPLFAVLFFVEEWCRRASCTSQG